MFRRSSSNSRVTAAGLLLVVGSVACLVWLATPHFRGPVPDAGSPAPEAASGTRAGVEPRSVATKLEGAAALEYLEQNGEGQSLMRALTAERFGLKWQEKSPFAGEAGGGYLGMSHEENLNAWFDEEGVTVRPTVSEKERAKAWRVGMRLKAYGYGAQLHEARASVSRAVKENRIEYERAAGGAGGRVVEWYVNKSEGIEQGFTLDAPPARTEGADADEPLRLVVSVKGDLRARAAEGGQAVELNRGGEAVLSYSKLVASDASGARLAARMETNEAGDEIALVVEDKEAQYPIVVDPITATQKQELDAGSFRQQDARFGFAVAIDGNLAVVGAWREDTFLNGGDAGRVYFFSRSGNSWNLENLTLEGGQFAAGCGWSVAISDNRVVFGCPGADDSKGEAYLYFRHSTTLVALHTSGVTEFPKTGVRYGTSVAISGDLVAVGAPFADGAGAVDNGAAYVYTLSGSTIIFTMRRGAGNTPNAQLGTAVATDGRTVVFGTPGAGNGTATVYDSLSGTLRELQANDGASGDSFGNSVAVRGNTIVVGAPLDDNERGADAGAAYVFVRGSDGTWTQQQKLMASDGAAGDLFSEHAVAIEGNTIVVGAVANGIGGDPIRGVPDDNRGAAYVFTRNITTWTQETKISQSNFQGGEAGDAFGIGVGISGKDVIIGARAASAGDTVRAGAAFIYELDCVPPDIITVFNDIPLCPGASLNFFPFVDNPANTTLSYQWRKNGMNIPGATNSSYVVASVSASDAGTYDVIISNSCGSEISAPSTVNVHTFSLNPTSQNFSATGSNGIVNVTSTGSCNWTATSNDSWITITSGTSGTGNGTVGFTAAANTGPNQRTGTITIAGQTFTVTQDGLNCSYAIAPTSNSVSAAAAAGSVAVTATGGCAWAAASNDSWLSINAGASGTGNGTVNYTVAANTGPARTGTLTIAGQTFTVTQASGCTYSITPTARNFSAGGGTDSINVTAGGGCGWTAVSNSPSFITITSGSSGTGNGTVGFTVAANTGAQRTGTLTIAGQTFTVTQDGTAPAGTTFQFSQAAYSVGEGAASATITVTRTGDLSAPAAVEYATTDGTASERKDYITALGRLRFAPGDASKSFGVLITDDRFDDDGESFNVTLSNPVGASLGAQSTATVQITDNDTAHGPSPVKDATVEAPFFVGQHYADFLNRVPDQDGLNFWVGSMTGCGHPDLLVCRINVSAAFFLSIENQETGYLTHRAYKVAFGDLPGKPVPLTLREYLAGSRQIGDGVQVGVGNWQQQLEANKVSFFNEFVTTSRFTALYNGQTNVQYVDALNTNASGALSSSERDSLVNGLNGGTLTRAQALRAVAEDADFAGDGRPEKNRAFVLAQYFGYLRRNPDDTDFRGVPDPTFEGYNFWLSKLNEFNGNFVRAEMVRAFIQSIEYGERFGQ